jgi:hypothetical protein
VGSKRFLFVFSIWVKIKLEEEETLLGSLKQLKNAKQK